LSILLSPAASPGGKVHRYASIEFAPAATVSPPRLLAAVADFWMLVETGRRSGRDAYGRRVFRGAGFQGDSGGRIVDTDRNAS
jgi:hypothetical protein